MLQGIALLNQSNNIDASALKFSNGAEHSIRGAQSWLAYATMLQGETTKCIEHAEESIKAQENVVLALNIHGAAMAMSGNLESAMKDFHRAMNIDPSSICPLYNLFVLYGQVKDFESQRQMILKLKAMGDRTKNTQCVWWGTNEGACFDISDMLGAACLSLSDWDSAVRAYGLITKPSHQVLKDYIYALLQVRMK